MKVIQNDAVGVGIEEGGEEERSEEHHVLNSTAAAGGGDNNNRLTEDDNMSVDEESFNFSEPDYDYLADDDDDGEQRSDAGSMPSSPDYDHLGPSCDDELSPSAVLFRDENGGGDDENSNEQNNENGSPMDASSNKEAKQPVMYTMKETKGVNEYCHTEVEDIGEEYILGTLMVRVLQAKNLKSNPHVQGGGIASLLSNHRLFRQQKLNMSPASDGNLTPSSSFSNQQQIYAKLSYRDQSPQTTSMALVHANGDYHWSRGDQSYFDVTCPSFPLRTGKIMHHSPSSSKAEQTSAAASSTKGDMSCAKPNRSQQQSESSIKRPPPPILNLSLYSNTNSGPGAGHNNQNKWLPYLSNSDNLPEKNSDHLLGKCSINMLRILSGKTPYFDEWCTLHNDTNHLQQPNNNDNAAGRVRIVIEYEPTDPPPMPGDMCIFANVYRLVDELYPIPLHSIRSNTIQFIQSSVSVSTLSLASSSSSTHPSLSTPSSSLTCHPKRYRVEEVVGDHVVLSYLTPHENWQCTFEVHRYLLLCVERHKACVEKYRERVLDLCDNLSQSPVVETLTRTVETLPDEGLVYVGAELVGGGVGLLGRWWEVGVEGLVEDVVDGINLDGRYSYLSDNENEKEGDESNVGSNMETQNPSQQGQFTTSQQQSRSNTIHSTEASPLQDKSGKVLTEMPCCPITALPMVEPVVAADGHTYERHAIARWLHNSANRSPLTGEILAHSKLVPNYLLLSSLGNTNQAGQEEDGSDGSK